MVLTLYKIFLFSLCPVTLLVGHLISYRVTLEVDKDGWFNTYFVKQGWFWTSLIGWWCMIRYGLFGHRGSWKKTLIRYSVLTAWWLIFTQSIWTEVAPLMDLVFTATGGRCTFDVFDPSQSLTWQLNEKFHDTFSRRQSGLQKLYRALKQGSGNPSSLLQGAISEIEYWLSEGKDQLKNMEATPSQLNSLIDEAVRSWRKINSSNLCRSVGGYWIGGHDPSGHIFLITLMCMFLLGELQVIGKKALRKLKSDHRFLYLLKDHLIGIMRLGGITLLISKPPANRKDMIKQLGMAPLKWVKQVLILMALILRFLVWENPVTVLILLTFMWWWSFLITTIAFHTLLEQISGLLCAYVVAAVVYWKLT
ncbi:LANO_0F02608g1_1 [Lachancea nothofagi CBS 11611]|uniref:Acyl-coenzyme A diphosphatase SCS3 n=1 Tax=Lachancea nothofagi CBS 11611 TaxID=1266666 RepID=A0A1G4K6W0_9SACH|nr:LANO_0F02608g1_1 [Lachancea nothofagi CBS 11611]